MASHDSPQRPAEPTPARPAQSDSMLESLGKAITDPVREAAGEQSEETRAARERAQVRADELAAEEAAAEGQDERPRQPPSPVAGR